MPDVSLWGESMQDLLKNMLVTLLTSKKALATLAGMVIAALGKYGLDLPEDLVLQLLGMLAAYVVGQGIADIGKRSVITLPTVDPKKTR